MRLSTGRQRPSPFSAMLPAMAEFDVLPAALVEAAAGVRGVAAEIRGIPTGRWPTGSEVLDAAVERFSRAWQQSSAVLADRGESVAAKLLISAARYADADDLVPHQAPR